MSIFFRYSPVPIVLSQPFDKTNSRDEDGDLKIVNFPNQWGSYLTSFSTSGWISLAANSGIFLNTPGYVDISGLRVNTIYAQNYGKINESGEILPLYTGVASGLVYKKDDNNLDITPSYIYNTTFNKITIPTATTGKLLYVGPGYDRGHTDDIALPTKEIDTYDFINLVPALDVDGVQSPSLVTITAGLVDIVESIKIGPNYNGFSGKVLTHMGADAPAVWKDANFLPEGVEFNRYVKRPVYIYQDRVVFYVNKPSWAADGDSTPFTVDTLKEEYGLSDTLELMDEEGNRTYAKFSDSITYLTYNQPCATQCDKEIDWEDITSEETIIDPIDTEADPYNGIAISICPPDPFDSGYEGIGFIFSVKKGAYFNLVTASGDGAKARFTCEGDVADSPFTFRPSTVNTISIRPTVYTSFNQIAEDIDFIVYGKKTVEYDNYDPNLFDLDENKIPSGLIPYLKIDAHIPNSVSGTLSSGVYFSKYLDREKLQPSGWGFDESAKVIINGYSAYSFASLPSGETLLQSYANLTVSGITYSDGIITKDIYLKPEPLPDGSSDYIANAVLVLDSKGKIISKKPAKNPTRPSKPLNIRTVLEHNNNGQANGQVSLEWDAPLNNGGSDIVDYVLQFSANQGNEWTTLPNVLTVDRPLQTQLSATIGNLSLNTQYIFRVAAQNGVGISEYSDPTSPIYSNLSLPGKPENFTAIRYMDETPLSEIELSWTPGHMGSGTLSGYILEESDSNGTTWAYYNLPPNFITSLSETITATDSTKNYLYRISAWNGNGQSAYSYVYVTGNIIPENEPPADQNSSWDFGKILFTGVCS
jgi:hypothetical protein